MDTQTKPILAWDFIAEGQWNILLQSLQELLDRKSENGKWRIDGKYVGWRRLTGYHYIDVYNYIDVQTEFHSNARKFLKDILPDTECHFRIYDEGKTLRIVNYHHDAPCGETYICNPCSDEEWEKV